MDYSKWKKILVILMIINLCFVIFSRITKSYGATSVTIESPSQYTFNLDNKFDSYSYIYIFYNPDFTNTTMNPAQHNMSFYFCASQSPIVFRQAMKNYGSTPYLTTYIKTQDNSRFYSYSGNLSINNTFTDNITRFNNAVNSSASLHTSDSWGFTFENANVSVNTQFNNIVGLYISSNINFENGDLAIPDTLFTAPHFDNSDTELQSLNFDKIFISMGSYTTDDPLYLKVLEVTRVYEDINNPSDNVYYYNDLTFTLTNNKNFLHEFFDSGTYYYSVPYSALKLKKDKSYYFILTNSSDKINQTQGEIVENDTYFDVCLCDTTNIVTTQDEIMNSIINNTPSDDTNNIINNNLPRPSYSDGTNVDIPGMNVNIPSDMTTDGFNYIFNMIYSQINPSNNSDPAQDIVINIPFVNQELRINKDFTRNLLGSDSPITALLSAFYYFIISYYIVNDIRKTIEKVRSGDIMTHTDTNIKADML